MSNKTAMMQLRDKCIEQAKELRLQPLFNTYNAAYADALESVAKDIDAQMLGIEKQQHSETWDKALKQLENRGHVYSRAFADFDDYYTETFNQ